MGISPSADRWNALIDIAFPPEPEPSECQADIGSCWCWKDAGHDGPHECGGLTCNGAWIGDDDATFEIVRWP